jgi:hypothetical protein
MGSVRKIKVPNELSLIPLIAIYFKQRPNIVWTFGFLKIIDLRTQGYIGNGGKHHRFFCGPRFAPGPHGSRMSGSSRNGTLAAPLRRHRQIGMFIIFILSCCFEVLCEECGVRPAEAASISKISSNRVHVIANDGGVVLVQNRRAVVAVENVAGPPGTRLPVHVVVNSALLSPNDGTDIPYVNFAGLPDSCRLSAGIKRTRSWSVPIDKLGGLMLVPDAGCEGDFQVLVMIYDGGDIRTDSMRTISFSIDRAPSAPTPSVRLPAIEVAPPVAPVSSALAPVSPALEEALLKKGDSCLKNGDISAARLNFETLALRGSARGAMALAKSFDPGILNSMAIAGLKPDLAKAKEWYAKAAGLGDKDASQRLSDLMVPRLDTAERDQPPTQ